MYKCDKCDYTFTRQSSLYYHLENDSCKKSKYECTYCHKGFTQKNSMYRHMKHSCRVKKEQDSKNDVLQKTVEVLIKENEDLKKRMIKENEDLKKRMTKMEKKSKAITTSGTMIDNHGVVNINNGNVDNRVVNNVTHNYIAAFGKEDMSQIDRDDIIKALKKGFKSTRHLTEVVHFNPKYPQFSNIKRTNFNMKNKIEYHDGVDWQITQNPHMIDDIYERKRDYIEENIEEFNNDLTKADIVRLHRWMGTADDDRKIQTIKDEIRELLYNKREVAKANEIALHVANTVNCESLLDSDVLIVPEISELSETLEISDGESSSSDKTELKTPRVTKEDKPSNVRKKIAPRNGRYRKVCKTRKFETC